jgi:hypothetical protein
MVDRLADQHESIRENRNPVQLPLPD